MPCSAVTFYDTFVDVIIPLVSAFLGGFVTLAGVWLTIRHERKGKEQADIQNAKPWIFSLDAQERGQYPDRNRIKLKTTSTIPDTQFRILIKNTDNGVGIIKCLKTENFVYHPSIGKVLDKNHVTDVTVCHSSGETLKNMFLFVSDIYGNEYKYRVFPSETNNLVYHIEEVKEE